MICAANGPAVSHFIIRGDKLIQMETCNSQMFHLLKGQASGRMLVNVAKGTIHTFMFLYSY